MKTNPPMSALRVVSALRRHAEATGQDPHHVSASYRDLGLVAKKASGAVRLAERHGLLQRISQPGPNTPAVYDVLGEEVALPEPSAERENSTVRAIRALLSAPGLSDREKLDAIARLAA